MEQTPISYMQAFPEQDCLRLLFPSRVHSENAAAVRAEVFDLLSRYPHTEVVADFDRVEYISSTGLRVLLELMRSEPRFCIVNVGPVPYEIFEMTGFLSMTSIRKKRRKISLEGATQIGWGYSSRVYRLDGDTIVKVYTDAKFTEHIEKELQNAKQAFMAGIPTAISYDIVEVGDLYGVVFEMMDGCTLRDAIASEPERFEEYMELYLRVVQTIGSTRVTDPSVPDAKQEQFDKLKYLTGRVLTAEEAARMERFLSSLPDADTYVHGDCQAKNIMLSHGEPMLIDMEMLCKGSPLFELGSLYNPYLVFEQVVPGNNEAFLGLSPAICKEILGRILDRCLPLCGYGPIEKAMDAVRLIGCFNCLYVVARFYAEHPEYTERAVLLFREALAKQES